MRRVATARRGLAPRVTRVVRSRASASHSRARRLHLLDPRRVVERGYAILRGADGRVVVDAAQAARGRARDGGA